MDATALNATALNATGGIAELARGAVTEVVRQAAARTGVDFSYLMAQARVESGLNPVARAATSSARGLYQFTDATWLETVRKHGAEQGLGWAADALKSGAARAGSAARATILGLRDDAQAAALMAGEFAADNAAALEARLGRAVGATDLYMAHFLGAGGAGKFLSALRDTPAAVAAELFPRAAATNRGVFFGRDGTARTVAEVHARFERKLGLGTASLPRDQGAEPTAPRRVEVSSNVPVTGTALPVSASRARMAYMLLAELGG